MLSWQVETIVGAQTNKTTKKGDVSQLLQQCFDPDRTWIVTCDLASTVIAPRVEVNGFAGVLFQKST